MANPAPTINQINAFNATQGTTIDFNIIGGTELVRSNRIYIYDLSDNSLICTHLYVSTESIHELPANTDSTIIYESGKSSADFVNGAQYYAQIQTYTDIAGTEGGSGLSVAKMFWCLIDPTLTITTIPSTISTTSYNVSATYNANTSVVSNIIQQYQFNLYSATGSLLQSSGVVVGSGAQQGTSTTYDISYNFTGLSVGSSYYVVVDVTTTQGMSVSAQSNTFTVSIDTPTLGEATVVNNACDGYISVTSNLSSEYGGSGSGDIVSFETDSENVFTKLQVNLEPIQDLHGYDKPWVGGAGKNKLTNNYYEKSVTSKNGITYTVNDDGSITLQGTSTAQAVSNWEMILTGSPSGLKAGTYIISADGLQSGVQIIFGGNVSSIPYNTVTYQNTSRQFTLSSDDDTMGYCLIQVNGGATINTTIFPMIRLASDTDTTWQPYENICPISGRDSVSANVVGKNLFDKNATDTDNGYVSGRCVRATDGATVNLATASVSEYISVKGGMQYVISPVSGSNPSVCFYDANKTFISGVAYGGATAKDFTTPSNAEYLRFSITNANLDITQIELGSTATAYEPYDGQTITAPLPTTVYGGTLDLVSGVLTVDKVSTLLDGSETGWSLMNNCFALTLTGSGIEQSTSTSGDNNVVISNEFPSSGVQYRGSVADNHIVKTVGKNEQIAVRYDTANNNVQTFQTFLANNPLQICYRLANPLTYQLTPHQIQTLVGQNNVWSEQGDVEVTYNIPITNLLVKRQDVADVSGTWLTLHSQPITQASDMDFTFIDFLNQYGKTYKYALVPLLTQTQSGVEVEVEGGYTVSDEVQSIFDGVFIADSTGSQKCKANVGYGNVDMNQTVGTITPIGAKYPVVITNSKNQYHNGSISGTIVPDDYYFNGNLSRIDMVNKRDELEQFLTNKRAKIIKDWNGKIWLVMIMDNVSCTFNNNYGMGIVNFSTNWIEVGDPTNQQDLQATGLIDVGGA